MMVAPLHNCPLTNVEECPLNHFVLSESVLPEGSSCTLILVIKRLYELSDDVPLHLCQWLSSNQVLTLSTKSTKCLRQSPAQTTV